MNHWAAHLVGKRWSLGATGPDTFDCRGLVRHAYLLRTGCDIPQLAVDAAHDPAAALRSAIEEGWHRVAGGMGAPPAREMDLVFMRSLSGFHVGLVVQSQEGLRLLHCVGGVVDGVEVGEVLCQPLRDVAALGFGRFEFWRKT
jgi:cell wall-associated NlpC family hydrolase